ncbi:MAG: hypothetical protein GY757_06155, partial [bacterium]|nr:hypothetical protein [bacterium]
AFKEAPSAAAPSPETVEVFTSVGHKLFYTGSKQTHNKKEYLQASLKLKDAEQKTGWIKYASNHFDYHQKWKHITLKQANVNLYEANPDILLFEEVAFTIEKKTFFEGDQIKEYKPSEGVTWIEVANPKDPNQTGWYNITANEDEPKFAKLDYWDWNRFFIALKEEKEKDGVPFSSSLEKLKPHRVPNLGYGDSYCVIDTLIDNLENHHSATRHGTTT